jgi:hypothetical protein
MEYTEKNYDFDLSICHPMVSNFKEKIARIIIGTIAGARLNANMKFESYGRIEFNENDVNETHPYICTMEQFNRVKTNCLIYNLPVTNTNNGFYDKCFIYCHTSTKDVVNYSYIFYNTQTNDILHDYYIEPEFDELFRHLNQTFNSFEKRDIVAFASKKHDTIRTNNTGKGINERAYNEMMNKHIEKFPVYVTNVTGDRRTNRFSVG